MNRIDRSGAWSRLGVLVMIFVIAEQSFERGFSWLVDRHRHLGVSSHDHRP